MTAGSRFEVQRVDRVRQPYVIIDRTTGKPLLRSGLEYCYYSAKVAREVCATLNAAPRS